jgi:hypothetical protein
MLRQTERHEQAGSSENSQESKKERSGIPLRSRRERRKLLVIVVVWAVVVVFVPITLYVPSLSVFVPPAMPVFPTPLARGDEVPTLFSGLWAVPTMFLGSPVQFMINVNNPLLAVLFIGTRLWRANQ